MGSQGTLGHGLHLEKGPPAPPASQKRNELPRELAKASTSRPVGQKASKVDPRGSARVWKPPGEADDGVPSGELTPHEWKPPAPGVLREEGGRSSWAGAGRGAAEAAGRFTPRPADWLRVAMSAAFAASCPCVCSWGNLGPVRGACGPQAARPGGCWQISFTAPVQPQVSGAGDITAFVYRSAGGRKRAVPEREGDLFPTPPPPRATPTWPLPPPPWPHPVHVLTPARPLPHPPATPTPLSSPLSLPFPFCIPNPILTRRPF